MPDSPHGSSPAPALSAPALSASGIVLVGAPSAPLRPFNGEAALSAAQPPAEIRLYMHKISPVFYNYRLADYNRRYYAAFLERAKLKNLIVQIVGGLLTVIAVLLLTIPAALGDDIIVGWVHRVNPIAALLSAFAFLVAVIAPMFGWDKAIDDFTTRVHAWQFAKNQIESALRFLIHDARNERDAELQVRFADGAFGIANSLPEVGQQEPKLSEKIKLDVEKAIPPDYLWRAL